MLLALLLAIDGGISAMLIMSAVSMAVSVAAGYLMQKKPKAPLVDERPSNLATRGTFLPYVIGRRRIGSVVCWVGRTQFNKHTFGMPPYDWFGRAQVDIKRALMPPYEFWSESGMHVLCIGPATALHSIKANGSVLFQGPITSTSHPSGSQIRAGWGFFYIYWGEPTQPINTNAGNANAIGINSRWPYFCYVLWDQINLGTAHNWPMLDYEIETRCQDSLLPAAVSLPSSQSYMPNTLTLSGILFSTITSFTDGIAGVANFTLLDDQTFYFQEGATFNLTGNALPNGDYPISTSTYNPITGYTTVYIAQNISGSNTAGTVEPYFNDNNDGINGAHILAQLLFCPFPYGMNLDPTYWDIASLDAVGALMVAENVVQSVYIQDGEDVQSAVAKLLQDMGVLIAWDVSQGKHKFVPVRQPASPPAIPDDAMCSPLPEIEALMLERPVDKLIYVFSDRDHNYREMTVSIDSDGQALFLNVQRAQKVAIPTTTVFTTAALIAERRSLEEFSSGSKIDLVTNRSTRNLIPGTAITIPGVTPVLRVAEIEIQPDSREVKISCVTDFYGCPESEFVNQTGAALAPGLPVQPDLFDAIEIPAYLLTTSQANVIVGVARIRHDTNTTTAELWLSNDNITYWTVGQASNVATGGKLVSGINASDPLEQANGPTFTLVGPDVAIAQDLTSDAAGWRAGKQIVLIDNEICFCQKITSLGGGTYQLTGFIRARYATVAATHGAGANVFIFPNGDLDTVQDDGLYPGASIYVKDDPAAGNNLNDALPLAYVAAESETLYGLGPRPMPMENLRANGGTNTWPTGTDITLAWNYRSTATPKTGCGMNPAGVPVNYSAVQGQIIVTITDLSGHVKRSFASESWTYLYTNATLVADFGSEPTAFLVNAYNISGPNQSPTLTTQVNKG